MLQTEWPELLELSILYAIKTMDGQESDDAAGVNEIEGMLIQERRTGRVQLDARTRPVYSTVGTNDSPRIQLHRT
jgi:hypothetical protein